MPVHYTPRQLREVAAVPPETYRHWKKALAPLRRDPGPRPCFTAGDLLAVALVRAMATDLSIRVGAFSPVADRLFEICNDTSWPILERSRLIVDLANQRLELQPESDGVDLDTLAIVCPLKSLVGHLQDTLLTDRRPEQQTLSFSLPPLNTRTSAASAGGGS